MTSSASVRPRHWPLLLVGGSLLLLAGCGEKKEAPPPPVRPILSVVVEPHAVRTFGFTGEIQPRYKVSLGFRILGRLVSRDVDVGDQVKAGAKLAAIDPLALDLAVRSAEADVFTARAQLSNATGVEERQRTLLRQNTATQAEFEAGQQAREAAAAALQRAEANLAKAREQRGYAELRSDINGVVTAIGAQVGQVVSPGQAVVTVARPDIREAAVDVPEEVARELKVGTPFDISLQLDPTISTPGKVREIAPQSDAVTRTQRVLITLGKAQDVFRLGTMVTAVLTAPPSAALELPRSALLEQDGKDLVWVFDPATGTVSTREVKVAERNPATFRVSAGLTAGMRVAIAGVHSLKPGEAVKIMDEGAR